MVVNKKINIVHLYATDMNIYGDTGNILALQYRLGQRGIQSEVAKINPGDSMPKDVDIVVAGGGQDSGQEKVLADLNKRSKELRAMADDGVVMLTVCGVYQLFGHSFKTNEGKTLKGISLFDMTTVAKEKRLIGNVVIDTKFGEMVGFENHSGQTYLGEDQASLGTVKKGEGNNDSTSDEGAVYNNVFGTYLHGPVLPKNFIFCDYLLETAVSRKYGATKLEPLNNSLEQKAIKSAKTRPR